MEPYDIIKTAAAALDDKKAQDIEAIQVRDLTILADYFLVASGSSSTQVKALADEVETKLSERGIEPHHIEGRATSWILLDYGTVIVHVFHAEARAFYHLDKMWSQGKKVGITKLTN